MSPQSKGTDVTELTFLRAPLCPIDAGELRAVKAAAAFLGAPVDAGLAPDREGTPLGPAACRVASLQFSDKPVYEYRIDVGDYWQLVDCGDAEISPDAAANHSEIRRSVEALLDAGTLPILFGGDHSISLAGLEGLCSRVPGRVGYLQIDAHLGLVHRAVEQANIEAANVAVIGVRGVSNSFEEIEAAEALGVRVFSMHDCIERGVAGTIAAALAAVSEGTDAVYVSFGNDAIDASHAPGTTTPEPGGLTTREMLVLADAVGRAGVAMLDVAGLSPTYDPAGITARLDCYWILYVLASYAEAVERGSAELPVYARNPQGAAAASIGVPC